MNTKFPLIVLSIVVIGGIAVLLTNQPVEAPDTLLSGETETEVVSETASEPSESMEQQEEAGTASDEVEPASDTAVEAEAEATVEATTETDTTEVAAPEVVNTARVFDISGTNFAFDVTELRVNKGDTVTINFVAAEGFHDWVVDEFDAATEAVGPGKPTSVTFVADTAGTYQYYCSVGSHRAQGMVGTLIVE